MGLWSALGRVKRKIRSLPVIGPVAGIAWKVVKIPLTLFLKRKADESIRLRGQAEAISDVLIDEAVDELIDKLEKPGTDG